MGQFNGWTFAAVNAIASEVANIQLRLYQVTGDDHEEQDDHPLLTLLDGVNERMTGIELKYVTMAHLELTGNAYWLLDGVTDDRSQPRAIYPLNPGRVRVQLDKTSYPYKLNHYTFTIDGTPAISRTGSNCSAAITARFSRRQAKRSTQQIISAASPKLWRTQPDMHTLSLRTFATLFFMIYL